MVQEGPYRANQPREDRATTETENSSQAAPIPPLRENRPPNIPLGREKIQTAAKTNALGRSRTAEKLAQGPQKTTESLLQLPPTGQGAVCSMYYSLIKVILNALTFNFKSPYFNVAESYVSDFSLI